MSSESLDFRRVNDQTFRLIVENDDLGSKELFINYTGKISPEAYEIVKKIGQKLAAEPLIFSAKIPYYYQDGEKIYQVTPVHLKRKYHIAKYFLRFFKFFQNASKVEIEISEKGKVKQNEKPSFKHLWKRSPVQEMMKEPIPLHSFTHLAFSDSYSKIATEAFQKIEPEFAARDKLRKLSETDHSRTKIVIHEGVLKLIPIKMGGKNQKYQDALPQYRNYLYREYGKEKVDYIAHLYSINLRGKDLTPEIVYRMNIGVGNLEKQDIEGFIGKMMQMSRYESKLMQKLTIQELRGIKRHFFPSEDLSEDKLLDWIKKFRTIPRTEQIKDTLSILSFSQEERSLQYTGREIAYPIMSYYTIADTKYYKPWVDQQELLQTFSDLENSTDFDHYCEKLTHIICKRHLVRKHPSEAYRVGALIPAPLDKEGNKRWYVVTSCISNGKGIHSYTLESLNKDDAALPAIKLYRSTAACDYALDGLATIRNDVNPINSPGYEGAEFTREYEQDFFKIRTIPLWVGYHLLARKELLKNVDERDMQVVHNSLEKACDIYHQNISKAEIPKPIKVIIRMRDAELLEIAQNLMKANFFNIFKAFRLVSIFFKYKNPLYKASLSEEKQAEERRDAQYILSLFPAAASHKLEKLKTDLLQKINPEIHCQEKEIITYMHSLLNEQKYEELSENIHALAGAADELPENKLKQSIIVTGHSLGGACAQKAFIDYTAKEGRIPLEGMEMCMRSFDAPAINLEDNQCYKQYGEHADLFKKLNLKFTVIHRMEAGDFVIQSGEEHLGVTANRQEELDLMHWSRFEASVSKGLESSKIPAIRDTTTAHATQFETGKRTPSYLIKTATEVATHPPYKIFRFNPETKPKDLLQKGSAEEGILADENQEFFKNEIEKTSIFARKRLGDYDRIWIDSQSLWKFNHGKDKIWRHIDSAWHDTVFRSNHVEKFRALLGVVLRVILAKVLINLPLEEYDAGHGHWWNYKDGNGVFAVDLNGITSHGK